jgi:hypothetical protein
VLAQLQKAQPWDDGPLPPTEVPTGRPQGNLRAIGRSFRAATLRLLSIRSADPGRRPCSLHSHGLAPGSGSNIPSGLPSEDHTDLTHTIVRCLGASTEPLLESLPLVARTYLESTGFRPLAVQSGRAATKGKWVAGAERSGAPVLAMLGHRCAMPQPPVRGMRSARPDKKFTVSSAKGR